MPPTPSTPWLDSNPVPGQIPLFRFAIDQADEPRTLFVPLTDAATDIQTRNVSASLRLSVQPIVPVRGCLFVPVRVEPADNRSVDSEETAELVVGDSPCRIVIRRSTCRINTALMSAVNGGPPASDTLAGLRWLACNRFSELVGFKALTSGRSGSGVYVFRPRRRFTDDQTRELVSSHPAELLNDTWGSWLLVKFGDDKHLRQEWARFDRVIRDRLNPFLARIEEYLPVRGPDEPASAEWPATLVSSFLGGDLIRVESLEDVIKGQPGQTTVANRLDRVFDILAPWHANGRDEPLGEWRRAYRTQPGGGWWLFNRFDLSRKPHRADYYAGLRWDIDFICEEHLRNHVWGRPPEEGLLTQIREIPARFGLAHGDLNARNVLCDEDNVWLIDFEHVGAAPVLVDFARLEANLRLWCLRLTPAGDGASTAAEVFERHLLDHFHGSEGGLEAIRQLAPDLGADPVELLELAQTVAHIRRRAADYCSRQFADRRDYLAVLYLTCLDLLRHAGKEGAAPTANFRLLLGLTWVTEEMLDRLLGRVPYRTHREAHPVELLNADWVTAPGLPSRVAYALAREDGQRALPLLAACRGVLQGQQHHLDVLDHTLLVIACVEALLEDPFAGFRSPLGLQESVNACLAAQGMTLGWGTADLASDPEGLTDFAGELVSLWERIDTASRRLLKWSALLHDVAKPATRRVEQGRVQFLGHENLAVVLLREPLQVLFPDQNMRSRLEYLIAHHHTHHNLVDEVMNTSRMPLRNDLQEGLRLGVFPPRARDWFATSMQRRFPGNPNATRDFLLLMLHGFADRLATRGARPAEPDRQPKATIEEVASIDLAVLRLLAQQSR